MKEACSRGSLAAGGDDDAEAVFFVRRSRERAGMLSVTKKALAWLLIFLTGRHRRGEQQGAIG